MKTLSQTLKALADPVRLRIVSLLSGRELAVTEIVSVLRMGQSRISRHLKILSDAGLLVSHRDGLWIRYTASPEGDPARFLSAVGPFLPSVRSDLKVLEDVRKRSVRETVKFFDSAAADWTSMHHEIVGPADLAGPILGLMHDCAAAADLGCGPGELLPVLRKKAKKVIGVDASAVMLRTARDRMGRASGYDFRLGTLEHLPLADAEADFCLCSFVLHHLSDPGVGLAEAHRVLKSGGTMAVVELLRHTDETMRSRFGDLRLGFDREELIRLLETAGFQARLAGSVRLRKGFQADIFKAVKKRR
jgi:ArsR family transcriptional regulator